MSFVPPLSLDGEEGSRLRDDDPVPLLFGPKRNADGRRTASLLRRTNVPSDPSAGVGRPEVRSETARAYRRKVPDPNLPQWTSRQMNETNLEMDSTGPEHDRSLKDAEYGEKTLSPTDSCAPPHATNIADMAPRYMADTSFGNPTSNNSHFSATKKLRGRSLSARSVKAKEVQRKHYSNTKQTHFILGDDPDAPDFRRDDPEPHTARQHHHRSFSLPAATSTPLPAGGQQGSKETSNIFRSGDYNDLQNTTDSFGTLSPTINTTQRRDFRPLSARREPPRADVPVIPNVTGHGHSTKTPLGYSHILPRDDHGGVADDMTSTAVDKLRHALQKCNYELHQNPRDPTSINLRKAFMAFDVSRTGFIDFTTLHGMCKKLTGLPFIPEDHVRLLLLECGIRSEHDIDYMTFFRELNRQTAPLSHEKDLLSEHRERYSQQAASWNETSRTCRTRRQDHENKHFDWLQPVDRPVSGYQKDFLGTTAPAQRAPAPWDGKVVPDGRHSVTRPKTANQLHFVNHKNTIIENEPERLKPMKENEISINLDEVELRADIPASADTERPHPPATSQAVFDTPGSHDMENDDHFETLHDILETDALLPRPRPKSTSEVKDSYPDYTLKQGAKLKKDRVRTCQASAHHSRNIRRTHYSLGDSGIDGLLTNKANEFRHWDKDALARENNAPSAGVRSLPAEHYTHIIPSAEDQAEVDGDGFASRPATSTHRNLREQSQQQHLNPRDPMSINLRKAFLQYDTQLTGKIAMEDMRRVCRQLNLPIEGRVIDELLRLCDKDRDGQIDYNEFARAFNKQYTPVFDSTVRQRSVSARDFNNPRQTRWSTGQLLSFRDDERRTRKPMDSHYFVEDPSKAQYSSLTRSDFPSHYHQATGLPTP